MNQIKPPYSFDGHGINDAEGQRIAKMSECGVVEKYIQSGAEGMILNPEFEQIGNLLAAAPDMLTILKIWDRGNDPDSDLDWTEQLDRARELTRLAIARAEGE